MKTDLAYQSYLGYWIKRAFLISSNKVNAILRDHGLARSQWEVLFFIEKAGKMSQKELQKILQIESATLTAIVESLVKKGWIVRREDQADRRAKTLSLTKEGLAQWKNIPDPIRTARKTSMKGISREEEVVAIELLKKIITNLENNV